jgi:hypothetical protein
LSLVSGSSVEKERLSVSASAEIEPLQYVIVSHNGEDKPFPVGDQEQVEVLLKETIGAFGVINSPHLFGLFTRDMRELKDVDTLRAAGVYDAEKLFLRQSVVRGG